MKDFEITEKNYLYLLRYFDGDVKNLNMDDLKNLKKGNFKAEGLNDKIKSKLLKQLYNKPPKIVQENFDCVSNVSLMLQIHGPIEY